LSIDLDLVMRDQLIERREKVATALSTVGPDPQLTALLRDVDSALARFESGTYGLCERCHDAMETDRVIANPLERFCLGCLTADEQRALEDDLTLASQIQRGLLPCRNLRVEGWHFDYRYEPARVVSGDYVDIIPHGEGDLYFILGDVSGKGVAASMLMTKLHAVFRTLIPLGLRVDQLTERASRLFGDSTLPGQFATLILGHLSKDQDAVSVCNAGHPPALLNRRGKVEQISATGFPMGMFPNQKFSVADLTLERGDSLLLYTDGVPDARNQFNEEYGMCRLIDFAGGCSSFAPEELVANCLAEVSKFRQGSPRFDDISIMGIRRE
jgi:sigma-B regulation protein RsbU (phosphoserine phosphatase)